MRLAIVLLAAVLPSLAFAQALPSPNFAAGTRLHGSPILSHVANNTALSLANADISPLLRDGFAASGDGGRAMYTHSGTACSITGGDGGSQVPAADGGCWLADFDRDTADIRIWGAKAGENVDAPLDAAIAWACQTHKVITLPYPNSPYLVARQHAIGNGSSSSLSTCNSMGFHIVQTQWESTPGTTPPVGFAFQYTGAPGVIPFVAQGPAASINISGLTVDCNSICSTGIKLDNIVDAKFDQLSVERWVNGPAILLTTEQDNPLFGGLEGSRFTNFVATVPGAGGSGIQIGDTTCTTCNRPVIADTFENFTVNWDSSTAGTYGLKLGFISQATFINMRITYDPVRGGTSGTPLLIAPPPGDHTFPTDIMFIHPLFTGTVDPGPNSSGWAPSSGGVNFIGWSNVYSPFPVATTYGNFTGNDIAGNVYPGPATWTPTDGSGAGLSLTIQDATYQKIGKMCTISFALTYPTTANGAVAALDGLPCTAASGTTAKLGGAPSFTDVGSPFTMLLGPGTTHMIFYNYSGGAMANSGFSGKSVRATLTYPTN